MVRIISILAVVSMLFACAEEEATRDAGVYMKFGLTTAAVAKASRAAGDSVSFTDVGGTSFTINAARVNIRDIEFDHSDEAYTDAGGTIDLTANPTVALTGPFVYDLINQTSTPAIPMADLPSGTYKRIDVRLDDADSADGVITNTDALDTFTMQVSGTYGANNDAFEMLLKFNEDIRFETATGIVVDATTATDMTLTMDVSAWMTGVNITTCITDGEFSVVNNTLMIADSAGSCSGIEGTIKTNIKNNYDIK